MNIILCATIKFYGVDLLAIDVGTPGQRNSSEHEEERRKESSVWNTNLVNQTMHWPQLFG